jgi:hypothetical protein
MMFLALSIRPHHRAVYEVMVRFHEAVNHNRPPIVMIGKLFEMTTSILLSRDIPPESF